jgi:hypothetical protein
MNGLFYQSNIAKPAFGQIKEPLFSSDYIKNKKSAIIYNEQLYNNNFNTQSSYENLNYFNIANNLFNEERCGNIPFNKQDLQINLFTRLNLNCVPVVATQPTPSNGFISPTSINTSLVFPNTLTPFYFFYKIDPSNALFGVNSCKENNYTKYLVMNTQKNNYPSKSLPPNSYSC